MATETPHSAGSLAILYADVLRHDLEHLAALTAAAPATRLWRSQRSLAQRLQGWLRSWRQQRPCPVCDLWREQERFYLHVLMEDWQEPELAQAFAASNGLCWLHTTLLVEQGRQHGHLQAVLAAQQVHLQQLQDELHAFIRKLDYRLARQPYGREADAWRRVVTRYIGGRGGQGSEGQDGPKGGLVTVRAQGPARGPWNHKPLIVKGKGIPEHGRKDHLRPH